MLSHTYTYLYYTYNILYFFENIFRNELNDIKKKYSHHDPKSLDRSFKRNVRKIGINQKILQPPNWLFKTYKTEN